MTPTEEIHYDPLYTGRYSPSHTMSTVSLTSIATSELLSSLFGNLADYPWGEQFQRIMSEFSTVVEREEEREKLRAHLYSTISSELNEIWWIQLPEDVRTTLVLFTKTDLPSTFASWWLQWEEFSPTRFPLPPSMLHFGPVKNHSAARFILRYPTQYESILSQAITRAWEFIPETSRQLMLFCWSGDCSARCRRYGVMIRPDLESSAAKVILGQDFRGAFENLHAAAYFMADYLFTTSN